MSTYEINGTYGGSQTPCTIFVYEVCGAYWYCVEDSVNVNCTIDELIEGVDVETIDDHDTCTAQNNINSTEELERFINEEEEEEEPNIIETIYESWVNGQRQQMINQLENATFSRGEFIEYLECDDDEKLKIAIYLLNNQE